MNPTAQTYKTIAKIIWGVGAIIALIIGATLMSLFPTRTSSSYYYSSSYSYSPMVLFMSALSSYSVFFLSGLSIYAQGETIQLLDNIDKNTRTLYHIVEKSNIAVAQSQAGYATGVTQLGEVTVCTSESEPSLAPVSALTSVSEKAYIQEQPPLMSSSEQFTSQSNNQTGAEAKSIEYVQDETEIVSDLGANTPPVSENEAVRFCRMCGKKASEGDEFCSNCGSALKM